MKKVLFICFASMSLSPANAQKSADLGIFAGTSYYLGELNPSGHFSSYNPLLGLIYRRNFSPHHCFRVNLAYSHVSVDAPEYDYLYADTDFTTSLMDLGLQYEFNFMPFHPFDRKVHQSTYVSVGAGLSFLNKPTGITYEPVIPFGVGWKVNVSPTLGLAFAWEFRKTFFDDFDGIGSLGHPESGSLLYHNDWYSFAGLILSFNIYNLNADCPAYDD